MGFLGYTSFPSKIAAAIPEIAFPLSHRHLPPFFFPVFVSKKSTANAADPLPGKATLPLLFEHFPPFFVIAEVKR